LSQFTDGGQGMENAVQTLLSADRANLAAIIGFAKTANEDQRKAIGRALAAYAQASAKAGDPGFANTIQQTVVNAGLPELQKAYADAGGDTGTAAGGGGGGGGGGGPTAVGPPIGGQNTGGLLSGNTVPTQATGLLGAGGLGGGGSSSFGNNGTSSFTSVSSTTNQ
jgi:hypothetical protein